MNRTGEVWGGEGCRGVMSSATASHQLSCRTRPCSRISHVRMRPVDSDEEFYVVVDFIGEFTEHPIRRRWAASLRINQLSSCLDQNNNEPSDEGDPTSKFRHLVLFHCILRMSLPYPLHPLLLPSSVSWLLFANKSFHFQFTVYYWRLLRGGRSLCL